MESFKIMTYGELRGERLPPDDPMVVTWRDRLVKLLFPNLFSRAFDLRRENMRLRTKLLAALKECEDAGKVGLMLYAENEKLREDVTYTPEQVVIRSQQLDELRRENNDLKRKLKRAYENNDDLILEHEKWLSRFFEKEGK